MRGNGPEPQYRHARAQRPTLSQSLLDICVKCSPYSLTRSAIVMLVFAKLHQPTANDPSPSMPPDACIGSKQLTTGDPTPTIESRRLGGAGL